MKSKPALRPPAALALAAALLAACGGGEPPTPSPVYSGVLGASEFTVGTNRFPFGLADRDGAFLEDADVTARFSKLNGADERFHSEANAQWRVMEEAEAAPHSHADGGAHLHLDYRGFYAVDAAAFPEPGVWTAEFAVADGTPTRPAVFEVVEDGSAPNPGDAAPRTANRTLRDAAFAVLSTRAVERDDLHNASVEEALDAGKPFVVFFASPQFCVSALCGPVAETLARAHQDLRGAVEFIHIEPWDLDIARNEGRLVPSDELAEWGLETEPWTFVVGSDGRIASRLQGPVAISEAIAAVRAAR